MTQSPADLFAPHEDVAQALLPHAVPSQSDSAHDLSHLLRVWRNVQRIQAQDGGDLRLLTAAVLLHDCVHVPKNAPHRATASARAADRARGLLDALGWSAADKDAVAHAITAHSFSAGVTPETTEAKILQDADRLDALGHIGIARCFAVSGQLGRPLYDPLDPSAAQRPLDDSRFALDHFQTKLLRLTGTFQTPTGQALAAARHDVLHSFMTGLLQDLSEA